MGIKTNDKGAPGAEVVIYKFPRCDRHMDCFANICGECMCLWNNDFGERDCPFYKNRLVRERELNDLLKE